MSKSVEETNVFDTQVGGNHYKDLAIQPLEYFHMTGIGVCASGVVKYITRWRNKGGLQDLLKAKHMIDLLIEMEELGA